MVEMLKSAFKAVMYVYISYKFGGFLISICAVIITIKTSKIIVS